MKRRNGTFKIGKITQLSLSVLYSLAVLMILIFTVSLISLTSKNPISLVDAMSIVIIVVGGIICGITLTRIFKEFSIQTVIISSLLLCLIILTIGIIIGGGKVNLKLPLNTLIYILCATLSAYLTRPRNKRHKFK